MPKDINDNYLGIIKYDNTYDWYEGKITDVNGSDIEFNFDVDANLEEVLEGTQKIIKNYINHSLKFKLYAAEQLLDLHNDIWNEGEVIEQDRFVSSIVLESISIFSDLSAEFYYLDGNLFAGHSIVISINSECQFENAYLAG